MGETRRDGRGQISLIYMNKFIQEPSDNAAETRLPIVNHGVCLCRHLKFKSDGEIICRCASGLLNENEEEIDVKEKICNVPLTMVRHN